MPTDVTPLRWRAELFPNVSRKNCDAEVKSGFLVFLGQDGRQVVRVVVYRTSLEHFAVIYPKKRVSKPVSVVNLRNTVLERCEAGFMVRQKGYDTTISARFLCSNRDVDSWFLAFTSRQSASNKSLPILVETEEN